jgi:hypothetical protein
LQKDSYLSNLLNAAPKQHLEIKQFDPQHLSRFVLQPGVVPQELFNRAVFFDDTPDDKKDKKKKKVCLIGFSLSRSLCLSSFRVSETEIRRGTATTGHANLHTTSFRLKYSACHAIDSQSTSFREWSHRCHPHKACIDACSRGSRQSI